MANLLALLHVSQPDLGPEDRRVLEGVLKKLPAALAGLDLTAEERRVLAGLLRHSAGPNGPSAARGPSSASSATCRARNSGPWDGPPRPGEVVVSPKVAERLYFATPGRSGMGLPAVAVRVEARALFATRRGADQGEGVRDVLARRPDRPVAAQRAAHHAGVRLHRGGGADVSALGIANTMLMSVLERTHEIGVLKAVGARDGDILGLFLVEGGLIGVLGAGLGLAAAWLGSFPGDRIAKHFVAAKTPMRLEGSVFAFEWWLVVGVPLGVVALAMLAAAYPARRAARLDPLEALRQR